MKLAIITCGYLPVPATKGGAVESLIDNFVAENEKSKKIDITIFSTFDENAKIKSQENKQTSYIFIKTPKILQIFDYIVYFIAKNILKKERTQSYRYIFQRLHYLNKTSAYLKKNNYDKILLENHPTLFYCLKKRKNYQKYAGKYYYHVHNEIAKNFGCEEIIKNSKKIICVSNFVAKQSQKFWNISNDNYVIIKNGINVDRFKYKFSDKELLEKKKELGIDENDIVLLFTGRFTKEKGIDKLLEAMKLVKSDNVKLLIAGGFFFNTNTNNTSEKEINKLINELNDKVINLGFVDYQQMPLIYNISDISIQPSICNDSAPLTIVESLNCGLPIITTNSGGIPEYANKECAFIFERDKELVKNIALSIDKLIDNKSLRESMSKSSLKRSEDLSMSRYYNEFVEILADEK